MAYPGSSIDFGGGVAAAPMTNYLATATTAELVDATSAINTTGKFVGKIVYNTTTGIPVFADVATAAGVWADAQGATEHTAA